MGEWDVVLANATTSVPPIRKKKRSHFIDMSITVEKGEEYSAIIDRAIDVLIEELKYVVGLPKSEADLLLMYKDHVQECILAGKKIEKKYEDFIKESKGKAPARLGSGAVKGTGRKVFSYTGAAGLANGDNGGDGYRYQDVAENAGNIPIRGGVQEPGDFRVFVQNVPAIEGQYFAWDNAFVNYQDEPAEAPRRD